jgi:coenzyme F420-reducing hydrogenase delta subunit/ferredoxin
VDSVECEGNDFFMKQEQNKVAVDSDCSPKIVAFLCTWCSYAGADLAGTGRNQYPPNIRVIRIPCSGRINPIYIIKALLEGADGVMVSGCHPGDCHYLVGNYYARRRFVVLKKLLTTAGFDPDKVHFTWVSASEGVRFAEVIKEVTSKIIETKGENLRGGEGSSVLPENTLDTSNYEKQQAELIPICKKLLEDKAVNRIVGFQKGGEIGLSLPFFFDTPEEADKLLWNTRCVPNLSSYLLDLSKKEGKTAIVAKPCDARAVVNLIKEKQLKRDDVYIIGLTCEGMTDETGRLLRGCYDCKVQTPPIYDTLIKQGDGSSAFSKQGDNPCDGDNPHGGKGSSAFSPLPSFFDEMEKCILCYSCRQSCYGCYCDTCFMERGEPDWQTASPDIGAKMLYHLGRAMHLAGRCIECGACENACASGVDIRYLIREVTNFIKDEYNYQAGMDIETEPAMLTYKTDDREIGFLGNTCTTEGNADV